MQPCFQAVYSITIKNMKIGRNAMTNARKTRRTKTAFLVAACCVLLSGTANAAEDLTLASFGGAYGESQKKAYVQPFQDLTGKKVTMTEYNGGLGEIRAQV